MGDSDLSVVYNAVRDVVTLFDDGVTAQLGGGTALPANVNASDLIFPDVEQQLQYTYNWQPYFDSILSPTTVSFGAVWQYGGRANGRGRFIQNARMWCSVPSLTFGHSVRVTGQWGDATLIQGADPENPVSKLVGYVTLNHTSTRIELETIQYYVSIKGDGSGRITRMG